MDSDLEKAQTFEPCFNVLAICARPPLLMTQGLARTGQCKTGQGGKGRVVHGRPWQVMASLAELLWTTAVKEQEMSN